MQKNNTIRIKVIGWFLLAALAVLLTGVISYTSYRELLGSLNSTSNQETKLKALGEILANITEAEAKMRAYGLNKEPGLLDEYQELVIEIESELEQVKVLQPVNQVFNNQVDSVSQLLSEQSVGITRFNELKKSLDQLSFSTKALEEISTTTDSIPALTTTTTTTTTTTVTTPSDPRLANLEEVNKVKNNKRQLRKRVEEITKVLSELQDKPQIQTETTIVTDSSFIQSDTLLDNIQQILVNISREENRYQNLVARKELQLIESSIQIIDQIRGLISSLEKQELAYNMERANHAKLIASRSTLTISIIIFICLILGILFTYWIFRDVRISDFYNRQLIGAKQQAEKLAESKQQFLANMSHEIRTPLNAIIGFTEQLAGTSLQPEQQDYLDAVQSSSHHLLNTVNDILDYSKIEAGELKIDLAPFELSVLLKEVINALQIKAKEKDLKLTLELVPEERYNLMGDPFRLKQILFNLVSNGIKFTDEGYVKVACHCSESNGRLQLKLSVSDSGIGIPRDQRKEIFTDFKQVDPSATRRFQGTGLGLAITKKLVEMQDGSIQVDSNEPNGTVFTVELEYNKSNSLEPAGRQAGQTGVSKSITSLAEAIADAKDLKGLKVLVADDDPFNSRLIKTMLAKGSFDVTFCSDGKQALDKIKEKEYDLVLTDINMPELSGVDLSKKVRTLEEEKRKIPIIALTANVMENDLEKYRSAGIDDFLLKPFREADLFSIISKYGSKKRPGTVNQNLKTTTGQIPFKLDDFKKFSAGDNEALRPILKAFYQNLNENLLLMNNHVAKHNYPAVADLAHKMISSFGHVHAMEAVQKLRQLENQIRSDHEPVHLEEIVDEIQGLAAPIMEGLKKELDSLSENSTVNNR